MKKYRFRVEEITLPTFTKLFLGNYMSFIMFFLALSIGVLAIAFNGKVLFDVLKFNTVLMFGVFLSFIIHEYLHINFLKKEHPDDYVEIRFGVMKISIIPEFESSPKTILKVAALPLLVMFSIGILLLSTSMVFEITFLMYTGIIYLFHILNVIPVFSDGIAIVKSIKMMIGRNERG